MSAKYVYKICPKQEWHEAQATGVFEGAPVDQKDGYIHFSTASQVRETAHLHFSGQNDLLIIAFKTETLGNDLIFEASRKGALFPHLYAPLKTQTALGFWPLEPQDKKGTFDFPKGLPLDDDTEPDFS